MGIGNLLLGDEGVGVQFVQQFEKEEWPDHVDFLDGGTGGFHLVPYMEKYETVVIIDATIMEDCPAGCVKLIEPKFASDYPPSLSAHDVGLKDLISSLYLLGKVPKVYLIAITIKGIQEMTMEMDPCVKDALPKVRNMLRKITSPVAAEQEFAG